MEISMLSFVYLPSDTISSNQDQFKKTKVRRRIVTTAQKEAALIEFIEENPHVSQWQIARQM